MADHAPHIRRAAAALSTLTGTPVDAILGGDRSSTPAHARHVIAAALRATLGRSYPQIGRDMGYADHTSAMHACKRIAALAADPSANGYPIHTSRLLEAAKRAIVGVVARPVAVDDWWATYCARVDESVRRSA